MYAWYKFDSIIDFGARKFALGVQRTVRASARLVTDAATCTVNPLHISRIMKAILALIPTIYVAVMAFPRARKLFMAIVAKVRGDPIQPLADQDADLQESLTKESFDITGLIKRFLIPVISMVTGLEALLGGSMKESKDVWTSINTLLSFIQRARVNEAHKTVDEFDLERKTFGTILEKYYSATFVTRWYWRRQLYKCWTYLAASCESYNFEVNKALKTDPSSSSSAARTIAFVGFSQFIWTLDFCYKYHTSEEQGKQIYVAYNPRNIRLSMASDLDLNTDKNGYIRSDGGKFIGVETLGDVFFVCFFVGSADHREYTLVPFDTEVTGLMSNHVRNIQLSAAALSLVSLMVGLVVYHLRQERGDETPVLSVATDHPPRRYHRKPKDSEATGDHDDFNIAYYGAQDRADRRADAAYLRDLYDDHDDPHGKAAMRYKKDNDYGVKPINDYEHPSEKPAYISANKWMVNRGPGDGWYESFEDRIMKKIVPLIEARKPMKKVANSKVGLENEDPILINLPPDDEPVPVVHEAAILGSHAAPRRHPMVASIACGSNAGTGFFTQLDNEWVLITAFHVVESHGRSPVNVKYKDEQVSVVFIGEIDDIAVFSVPKPPKYDRLTDLIGCAVAKNVIDKNRWVSLYSVDGLKSVGLITDWTSTANGCLAVSATYNSASGDSGSPVILTTNGMAAEIVGVHNSAGLPGATNVFRTKADFRNLIKGFIAGKKAPAKASMPKATGGSSSSGVTAGSK